jgi:hypothetical protein
MLVPEPEHWTVCINRNQKEVRTVGMSTRLSIIKTSVRTEYSNLYYGIILSTDSQELIPKFKENNVDFM